MPRASRAQGHAALTFDDGLVDNLENLVPLLREEEAPATVFVVSGWLGEAYPWGEWTRILTLDELRELAASGVEIGAHSTQHAIWPRSATSGRAPTSRSAGGALEDVVGPVETAAYPYGRASERDDSSLPRRRVPSRVPDQRRGLVDRSTQPAAPGHAQPLERGRPAAQACRPLRAADALRACPCGAAGLSDPESAGAMILGRPVVLVYHGVASASDEQDPRRLLVSPAHLEAHVRLLKRRGYDVVPAGQLSSERGAARPDRLAHLR